ncbi:MAG: hypothetical protein ACSHWU_00380 [Marinicella sp.]
MLFLFIWLTDFFPWYVALLVLYSSWALILMLIPVQIDPKDPINKIVRRIQAKKSDSQT